MIDRNERFHRNCYKPRPRRALSLKEIEAITEAYIVKMLPRKDVARQFRVTEALVSGLVCEARNKPEKLREAKAREKLLNQKITAIEEIATEMQQEEGGIQNALMVCNRVEEIYNLEVTEKLAR